MAFRISRGIVGDTVITADCKTKIVDIRQPKRVVSIKHNHRTSCEIQCIRSAEIGECFEITYLSGRKKVFQRIL